MTSASKISSSRSDQSRLTVKPPGAVTGSVNGGWWPGSRDLVPELRAVAAELEPRLGRLASVSYHLGAWELTARKIDIDGWAVRLAGYRTQNHDTVDVIGTRGRLTLLVVPPETDPGTARDALAAAGERDNTESIDALLHADREAEPALAGSGS